MILSLDTAPAGPALFWEDEVKGHLRVDSDEEQARVTDVLVPAAADWVEALTNRALITQTWKVWYPSFGAACSTAWRFGTKYAPGSILLPRPPLQSVTWVKYYDSNNTIQTWAAANYTVTAPAGPKASPGWILPIPTTEYPSTYTRPDAVEIKIVCGYGLLPKHVPGGLREAMLLLVGEMFERREIAVAGTIIADAPLAAVNLALGYLVEI